MVRAARHDNLAVAENVSSLLIPPKSRGNVENVLEDFKLRCGRNQIRYSSGQVILLSC